MRALTFWFLVACSVAVGAGRVGGLHGAAFQAIAHLWVGALIGAAVNGSGWSRLLYVFLAAALSAVEVVAFLTLAK